MPIKVFVKVLRKKQLVNELVAGVIGRSLGLPIPDFYLIVEARPSMFPHSLICKKLPENVQLSLFGMRITEHPTLARWGQKSKAKGTRQPLVSSSPSEKLRSMMNWSGYSEAIAFDDWIANASRDKDSLLIAPRKSFYLIDHEKAFNNANWQPSDIVEGKIIPNWLADEILSIMTTAQKRDWRRVACRLSERDKDVERPLKPLLKGLENEDYFGPQEGQALLHFIVKRLARLEKLYCERTGEPQLRLL